jgi:hypothetical protein
MQKCTYWLRRVSPFQSVCPQFQSTTANGFSWQLILGSFTNIFDTSMLSLKLYNGNGHCALRYTCVCAHSSNGGEFRASYITTWGIARDDVTTQTNITRHRAHIKIIFPKPVCRHGRHSQKWKVKLRITFLSSAMHTFSDLLNCT